MTVPARERGTTTVAPRAVRRIAERAAAEALPDGGSVTRGSATVRGASARIAVDVRLPYPVRADEAAQRVRERAEARTSALTGLSVPRAAVRVDALAVTAPAVAAPEAPVVLEAVEAPEVVPGPRIRAERRVPSAALAAVGAVACGLVLADVVAVRLGGAPAGWRTAVLDWAAAHGPADSAVRIGGAVAAVVGAWLLGCALLPGARRRLRMGAPAPELRAQLDRTAAARILRERALGVSGVVGARVGVRRRRARVRLVVGYGDPEEVRSEAVRVLDAGLAELGLARTPVLRVGVQVRRDASAEAIEPSAAPAGTDRYEVRGTLPDGPRDGRQGGLRNEREDGLPGELRSGGKA
ncbi:MULTISPECIES: DUF6286 domain-containing protein [Streptomyces]|uniref:DUF6286 domain-containing protein n=1 Tax=Streptomyces TaxID=1883 RepID=UPI00103F30F2|nr:MULTISPECIES: DUF6286 domain-containing protein [Streptomyces]MBT3075076.1 DEAD/DEAH box helicase [Streptomyces sp. COG21]MBT3088964.1 DEAD/DEAH box helicase [Streptomyces sp. CYG21]MBT3097778.1 DEAD/DEAH box helicase [Streptomyces sp. CBG30]MBT3103904.1 DEAD/DEAH box helicase [Streptomyces sp. COG19]MBT3113309.1 DEAD/DEAH box helicase [Streptomyces sp. CYG20]